MRKTTLLFYAISLFFLSGIFTGCSMENFALVYDVKLLDYEMSKETIQPSEPVELTSRWCFGDLDDDEVFSIKRLDNLNMELIDGELCKDDENAMFVKFIQPQNDSSFSNDEAYAFCPYCKLCLLFNKSGSYKLKIIRTKSDILN